jgi:hypothetical protein
MMLDKPVMILFYGGKLHGSKRLVNTTQLIVTVHPKARFRMDSVDSYFYAQDNLTFTTEVYTMKRLNNSKFYPRRGAGIDVVEETARAMMLDGKKYDSNKVWTMMKRYNCLPYYEERTYTI